MTEKRFITRNGVFYTDTKTGYEFQCYGEVVDIMNELADENEQLKQFKEYVFDLIDKDIKETKEIFEDGKIDLMMYNASMITLIGLKEQLKGDDE